MITAAYLIFMLKFAQLMGLLEENQCMFLAMRKTTRTEQILFTSLGSFHAD